MGLDRASADDGKYSNICTHTCDIIYVISTYFGVVRLKKTVILPILFCIVLVCFLLASCAPFSTDSGISGHVIAGQAQPVASGTSDAKPFTSAVIIIRDQKGGKELAHQHVDSKGAFKIFLPAGTYYIDPQNDAGTALPYGPPQTVEVQKSAFTDIIIVYDTGLK